MFAHPVPRHKDQSNKGTSMHGLCSSWRPDTAERTYSCSIMTPIKCWFRGVYGPCNWTWARKMINNLSQTFNTITKSPMMLQNPSNAAFSDLELFRLNANILQQLGQVMHCGCTTPKAIQTLYDHTHLLCTWIHCYNDTNKIISLLLDTWPWESGKVGWKAFDGMPTLPAHPAVL